MKLDTMGITSKFFHVNRLETLLRKRVEHEQHYWWYGPRWWYDSVLKNLLDEDSIMFQDQVVFLYIDFFFSYAVIERDVIFDGQFSSDFLLRYCFCLVPFRILFCSICKIFRWYSPLENFLRIYDYSVSFFRVHMVSTNFIVYNVFSVNGFNFFYLSFSIKHHSAIIL